MRILNKLPILLLLVAIKPNEIQMQAEAILAPSPLSTETKSSCNQCNKNETFSCSKKELECIKKENSKVCENKRYVCDKLCADSCYQCSTNNNCNFTYESCAKQCTIDYCTQ